MALDSLTALDVHKAVPYPPGYPDDARTFYSPVDDVHGALKDVIGSATKSLVIAMYGYDDAEIDGVVRSKLNDDHVYVQMILDSSQAGAKSEEAILQGWHNDKPGNSVAIGSADVAIGRSEKGAIMHMKIAIIDGVDIVTGSTNWSFGGEHSQDNQLTVIRNPVVAAEARARVDVIHDVMLKQMAAKRRTPPAPTS